MAAASSVSSSTITCLAHDSTCPTTCTSRIWTPKILAYIADKKSLEYSDSSAFGQPGGTLSPSFLTLVEAIKGVYSPLPTKYWYTLNGEEYRRDAFSKDEAMYLAKELVSLGIPSTTISVSAINVSRTWFVVRVQNHGEFECDGNKCECFELLLKHPIVARNYVAAMYGLTK